MSVYVDDLMNHGWHLGPSCHMWADTEEELHAFAAKVGLKRQWFQQPVKPSGHRFPHYDLTAKRRAAAVKLGAIELDRWQAREKRIELGMRPPHTMAGACPRKERT